jgi:predicted ATPase
MTHLRVITLDRDNRDADRGVFPFSVPVVRALTELLLDTPVTFFVGENGSGKSTILEAIAAAAKLPAVGSLSVQDDATLGEQRQLARALKLVWNQKTRRGFFLRAEDFFGFTKSLARERAEYKQRLLEIDEEYRDRPMARGLAAMPFGRALADMERRYGVNLDANSHGESFLKLFQSRLVPGGLFLLDEPEAPLSPQSQLALLVMIHDMVARDAQFIIATHSPIVLAFPGARIYSFDGGQIRAVEYDSLEHVALTRDFLNEPRRFLRYLTSPSAADG